MTEKEIKKKVKRIPSKKIRFSDGVIEMIPLSEVIKILDN